MKSSSICSDSEISTISLGSFVGQPAQPKHNNHATEMNSTFTVENQDKQQQQQQQQQPPQPQLQHQHSNQDSEYYNEEELWHMMDADEMDGSVDQTNRPSYLELAGNSGNTPIVSRKPRFQFSSMLLGTIQMSLNDVLCVYTVAQCTKPITNRFFSKARNTRQTKQQIKYRIIQKNFHVRFFFFFRKLLQPPMVMS